VAVGSGEHACSLGWIAEWTDIEERDVAAGIAILTEAGGLVTTANPPSLVKDIKMAPIPTASLGGRLYMGIRYGPPNCSLAFC